MRRRLIVLLSFITFFMLQLVSGAPQIWTTDIAGNPKTDFSPKEIVYINGMGFAANAQVTVEIIRPDSMTEGGYATTNSNGAFVFPYDLDGIMGTYQVSVTDGVHIAATSFQDAQGKIYTRRGGCSGPQDENHYGVGEDVWIEGENFAGSTIYSWTITGVSGCEPGTVVASGTVESDSDGDFCLNAYTVHSDDCGEYKAEVGGKKDNYQATCVDHDGDGYDGGPYSGCPTGTDCDDADPSINPGAAEVCDDAIDNDCDNLIDCADPDCSTNPVCSQTCTTDADCDDSNACTIDTCNSGTCQHVAVVCNDGIYCTLDSCNPSIGCVYDPTTMNGLACDDAEFCTTAEQCLNGACTGGTQTDCSGFADECNYGLCDEINDKCYSDPKPAGTLCGQFRNCPDDSCNGFVAEFYPDDGNDYCDATGNCVQYTCAIENSYCTDNDAFDGINSLECGAPCDADNDCPSTECDYKDGCYSGKYRDYHDVSNTCQADCSCTTNNLCNIFTEPAKDSDNDGVDDPCDRCPDSMPGEPVDQYGCDGFQFCEQFYCSPDCFTADWRYNEFDKRFPHDCTVVILNNEGTFQLRCVPLTCAD